MKPPRKETRIRIGKQPRYAILLKLMATIAVGLFLYAAAVTARSLLFGEDGGLGAVFFFSATMVLGYLAGGFFLKEVPGFAVKASMAKPVKFTAFMLDLKDPAYAISIVVSWAMLLLPLLVSLAVHAPSGIFRVAFELVVVIVAYAASLKYSQQSFTQIMGDTRAYAGFAILGISLELATFFGRAAYLKPWLLGISYFFILAYLLIKNQEDIDQNIFDKKHIEKSILPRNLRRFNTFWVCMLFLAILLLFNLKPLIVFLLKLAVKISLYLAAAFAWLIGHLFRLEAATPQGASTGGFAFFGSNPEVIRPLFNLISNISRNAVLLYLAYRLILLLVRWIPAFLRRLLGWIRKFLSIKKGDGVSEPSDYSDETETVKPAHGQEKGKSWKKRDGKSIRSLKRITDPVERVRFMYASILSMLPSLGIRTEPGDTTGDILCKTAGSVRVSEELTPFTQIYNRVRYGETVPDDGMLLSAEEHFHKAVEGFGQK